MAEFQKERWTKDLSEYEDTGFAVDIDISVWDEPGFCALNVFIEGLDDDYDMYGVRMAQKIENVLSDTNSLWDEWRCSDDAKEFYIED